MVEICKVFITIVNLFKNIFASTIYVQYNLENKFTTLLLNLENASNLYIMNLTCLIKGNIIKIIMSKRLTPYALELVNYFSWFISYYN